MLESSEGGGAAKYAEMGGQNSVSPTPLVAPRSAETVKLGPRFHQPGGPTMIQRRT